jgi:hypothetical protein
MTTITVIISPSIRRSVVAEKHQSGMIAGTEFSVASASIQQ